MGRFDAGDKLAWIEQVSRDLACSGFDVRVAIEISSRTFVETGEARVSQMAIAERLGKSARWVRASMHRLGSCGHLRTMTIGCGPGKAATLWPLRKSRDQIAAEQRNGSSADGAEQRKVSAATAEGLCTNSGSTASAIYPLKNPSNKHPAASAPETDPLSERWALVRKMVGKWIGVEKARAWLDPLTIGGFESGVVTLVSPTKFHLTYVESHHSRQILDAWRKVNALVSDIHFKIAPTADAGDLPEWDWRVRRDRKHAALADLRRAVEADRAAADDDEGPSS